MRVYLCVCRGGVLPLVVTVIRALPLVVRVNCGDQTSLDLLHPCLSFSIHTLCPSPVLCQGVRGQCLCNQ